MSPATLTSSTDICSFSQFVVDIDVRDHVAAVDSRSGLPRIPIPPRRSPPLRAVTHVQSEDDPVRSESNIAADNVADSQASRHVTSTPLAAISCPRRARQRNWESVKIVALIAEKVESTQHFVEWSTLAQKWNPAL
jgi:hypothetical protein